MNKENFKDWIVFKPDWNEIGWQYNTGKRYQNKQDLIAVFWNSYIYLQQKFEAYHSKYEKIPHDYFKELIFKFRQKFPKNGRIEGINYYDDLIEQLLEKYSQPQPVKETPTPENESEFSFVNNFDDVDEADVYNHFKKLVEKKMLTEEQFNKYLIKAFQENKPPKKLFKLKNEITKKRLRQIFYTYFRDVAQRPHGKKDIYVKLLSDYFEGYLFTTTKSNFNK